MSTATSLSNQLPPPAAILERIAALEDEVKALRRLLRASKAAHRAEEARQRRQALEKEGAGHGSQDH
jgi:hypothetical protein